MSSPGEDKVTVRVEVVVEGGRASVEAGKPTSVETKAIESHHLPLSSITHPSPCPTDTPIVRQTDGVKYIEAWGDAQSMNGKYPWKVWALAYPMTGVTTAMHPTPDMANGAVSTGCSAINGHWAFLLVNNNPVPGANCDGTPCASGGSNNSTFLVWYDYGTPSSPNYSASATPFHGYCPGSGKSDLASMSGAVAVGSFHLATTLHATFTGALAKLGTVALTWNGVSWAGESSAGGGSILSLLCHDGTFQLMSAGPGTAFIVAGQPRSCQRFFWAAEGTAQGALAGRFGVTLTE